MIEYNIIKDIYKTINMIEYNIIDDIYKTINMIEYNIIDDIIIEIFNKFNNTTCETGYHKDIFSWAYVNKPNYNIFINIFFPKMKNNLKSNRCPHDRNVEIPGFGIITDNIFKHQVFITGNQNWDDIVEKGRFFVRKYKIRSDEVFLYILNNKQEICVLNSTSYSWFPPEYTRRICTFN